MTASLIAPIFANASTSSRPTWRRFFISWCLDSSALDASLSNRSIKSSPSLIGIGFSPETVSLGLILFSVRFRRRIPNWKTPTRYNVSNSSIPTSIMFFASWCLERFPIPAILSRRDMKSSLSLIEIFFSPGAVTITNLTIFNKSSLVYDSIY
mgnify:CR=1 FL=1